MNSTEAIGRVQRLAGPHFFTVDVEEHFQVSAFDGVLAREDWSSQPSRVVPNTEKLLDLLARHSSHGTFFVLGWVAEKHPGLVRRIVDAGHEVGSHGYSHRRVPDLTPEEFRHDIRLAKQIIEDAAGRAVLGYRAPSFSIRPGFEWAFEVLLEEGYVYDSSLFPIRRPGYGYPASPPLPHMIQTASGHLCEFPMMTTVMSGVRLPAAGGAYFRHLPYALAQRALREHENAHVPGMFYIHPWEIDPEQPRIRASLLTTLRHYRGLRRTMPRLERLAAEFSFCSVESRLPDISKRAEWGGMMQIPGP
jgi:polysaccharide deacetylase family protein (PEP-CTERM system associated)